MHITKQGFCPYKVIVQADVTLPVHFIQLRTCPDCTFSPFCECILRPSMKIKIPIHFMKQKVRYIVDWTLQEQSAVCEKITEGEGR